MCTDRSTYTFDDDEFSHNTELKLIKPVITIQLCNFFTHKLSTYSGHNIIVHFRYTRLLLTVLRIVSAWHERHGHESVVLQPCLAQSHLGH